uniref:Odorant receptor n=1 Tax=Colaphellus bowringi TaxID=561076 RepID=A0A0S3J2S0_9CUCU|nr:odorant receptor OR4 [Colaphellus bowringi]
MLFYVCGFAVVICEYMMFKESIKDIGKFVSHIGMVLTHLAGIVKFCLLTIGHGKILKLMHVLQNKDYQYCSLEDSKPGEVLRKGQTVNNVIAYSTFVMYTLVGITGHISSVRNLNEQIKGDNFEGTNKTCYDFLPYMFYIPIPSETKWQCEMVFNLMDIGFALHAFVIAAHDGIFAGLLICLKSQLLIVCDVYKTIRQRSLKNMHLPENYTITNDMENPALENEMYRLLVHSMEHLKILLWVRDELEYIFTMVVLTQTVASLFILASNFYVASTILTASLEFFAKLEYTFCIFFQLSLICWFGDDITRASDLIKLSLYESDWLSSSPRFKHAMVLTMIRMQRPVFLSIGKFTPITLSTLVAVCRGSFSYFALFKSIQK